MKRYGNTLCLFAIIGIIMIASVVQCTIQNHYAGKGTIANIHKAKIQIESTSNQTNYEGEYYSEEKGEGVALFKSREGLLLQTYSNGVGYMRCSAKQKPNYVEVAKDSLTSIAPNDTAFKVTEEQFRKNTGNPYEPGYELSQVIEWKDSDSYVLISYLLLDEAGNTVHNSFATIGGSNRKITEQFNCDSEENAKKYQLKLVAYKEFDLVPEAENPVKKATFIAINDPTNRADEEMYHGTVSASISDSFTGLLYVKAELYNGDKLLAEERELPMVCLNGTAEIELFFVPEGEKEEVSEIRLTVMQRMPLTNS